MADRHTEGGAHSEPARRPMTTAVLATVLVAGSGVAEAQQVVPLDPERPAQGRLLLSAGMSEAHTACPTSTRQFALDPQDDAEWSLENRVGWNPAQVIPVVREAFARARGALPGPAIDLCLGIAGRPTDPTLERMNGIAGAAFVPSTIMLVVSPSLNPDWLERLPFTIAHEYHHLATARGASTGLDVLIREGRAHHFAWQLYPETLHPSARALTTEQVQPAWDIIRDNLAAPPGPFLRTYMFGGRYYGGVVPGWAGYTLGFCLVWAYAEEHPDSSAIELARVPVRAFASAEARCPAVTTSRDRR